MPITHQPAIACLAAATLLLPLQAASAPPVQAIYRSDDRGRSWSRSDAGLPGDARINALAAAGDSVFAGSDSGLYVSVDDGRRWRALPGLAATSGRITSFAAVNTYVVAGTDRSGVLVSKDEGRTWSPAANLAAHNVRSLLVWGGSLYAGTDADGVFVSADHGQTWLPLQRGLPARSQVFALASIEGRLFAGLYSQGLYSWRNQEQVWRKSGDVSPLVLASAKGTLVVGHNPGGIFWSDDSGLSWNRSLAEIGPDDLLGSASQSSGLAYVAPVWSMASDDQLIFAGASNGIFFSEDCARTWTRAQTGLPPVSPGISFLIRDELVLAGTIVSRSHGQPPDPVAR